MYFAVLKDWIVNLDILDLAVFCVFLFGTTTYKIFLAEMLAHKKEKLYLNKLQAYRKSWIDTYGMGMQPIIVVQTIRNNIMIGSFMASTAIILVMGCFNLLFGLDLETLSETRVLFFTTHDPYLRILKIMMLIVTLLYSFFHFLWHVRELHNMSLILNVPKEKLKDLTSMEPADHLSRIYLNSGIHFALGIRGYYFLIPLLLWMFHPVLTLLSFFGILFFLLRRDLGMVSFMNG